MEPLKNTYLDLFELESRKHCMVADRFFEGNFAEHWTSQLEEEGTVLQQREMLVLDLANVTLQPGEDQWKCLLDPSG